VARRVASYNESPPPPLFDCEGIERRVGARASSETEKFRVTSEALTKGSVCGSFILIRIVDPGNRSRCDLFHLRGVVSGHFVDAAGGYSDVDPCRNIHFVSRTGTCGLKCVIPMKRLTKVGRTCAKHSPDSGNSTASPGDVVKLEDVVPNRSLLFRAACQEQRPPVDTGLETDE